MLVDVLDKKQLAQQELQKSAIAAGGAIPIDVQRELNDMNNDIRSLRDTFELLTIGDIDDALFNTVESSPFDWKVELMWVLDSVLIA